MKRCLSVIIIFALIFTMLPAVSANGETPAEEVAKTLNFVFNASSHPGVGYTAATLENTDTTVSDRWGYAGIFDFYNYSLKDSTYLMYYALFDGRNGVDDGEAPGELKPYDPSANTPRRISAIEIDVTAAGTYNPSFTFDKTGSGLIWEIHLIKNTNAPGTVLSSTELRNYSKTLSANTRIGCMDLYGSGTETVDFPSITLEKATYYLLLFPVGINENAEYTVRSSGEHESENYMRSFELSVAPAVGTTYDYNINSQVFRLSNDTFVSTTDSRDTNTLKYVSADNQKSKEGSWYNKDGNDTAKALVYTGSTLERYIDTEKSMPWAYVGETGRYSTPFVTNAYLQTYMDGDTTTQSHYAMRITVPEKGKYTVSVYPNFYGKSTGQYIGGASKIYVENADGFAVKTWTNDGKTSLATVKHYTNKAAEFTYEFEKAGSYVLVFEQDDYDEGFVALKEDENNTATLQRVISNIKKISLTYKGVTDAQKALDAEKEEVILPGNNGETENLTATSSIKVLTADISTKKGTVNSDLSVESATIGRDYEIEAPKIEGKKFLYWAKGIGLNKAGFSDSETVSVKAEIGALYLTAVYRDAESDKVSVEFYNGNGELWNRSDITYSEGDTIALPQNPTMTGYNFIGWRLAGDDSTLITNESTVTAKGEEMLFVAQYEDDAENVSVKINGENKTYAYGEEVTLTANERDTDGFGIFAYWQKKADANSDMEIVSFDKSYTFRAYAGCEIEAVYRAYDTPAQTVRKILLGTNGEINIAEFIGINGAVEKGIIFGNGTPTVLSATHKIKMGGNGDYISAINDVEDANARGYAIFENGEVLYSE